MKKSIIIASCMLLAISCNLLDDDDNDNGNGTPNVPPPSSDTDVAVTDFTAPDSVVAGTVISLDAQITNSGDEAVSSEFLVILQNETTETNLDTVTVESLAVDAVSDITFEWNSADTPAGENVLRVFHNLSDDNADNNFLTDTVTVTGGNGGEPIVDVSVMEVNAPDTATIGSVVDIDVTLENLAEDAVADDITVILTDNTSGEEIATEVVSGIEAGAQSNLTFSWNTETLEEGEYTLTVAHDYMDDNDTNNEQDVVIYLQEEATANVTDIAISEVTASETVTAGDTATIEVTLANAGDVAVDDDIILTVSENGMEIGTETVSGLAIGAEETLSFTWNTEGVAAGEYELTVSHDFTDADETNNETIVTITVQDPTASNVDLAITNVSAPSNVTRGDTAFVEVTIENLGTEGVSEDVSVILTHHGNQQGSTTLTGGLAAGASTTVTIEWLTQNQTTGAPPHPLEIIVEYEDADAANNVENIAIQVDPAE